MKCRYNRNIKLLGKHGQDKIRRTTVAVIGLGGIGAITSNLLARTGFSLVLVDYDKYEEHNLNRQIFSNKQTMGRFKTDVVKKELEKINPGIRIKTKKERLTKENIGNLIRDADFVVDALDNLISRVYLSRACSRLKKPLVHTAAYSHKGQLTCFLGCLTYESLFGLPSAGKELTSSVVKSVERIDEKCDIIIGPLPNLLGCIAASECIKLATRMGKPIVAPKVLFIDVLKPEFVIKAVK